MAPTLNRERLKELLEKYPEPWVIEKEPHSYDDGTTHFTHVRYHRRPKFARNEEIAVEIGSYVTPDFAELLLLLRQFALEVLDYDEATK
jgi:hypothetical protein